MTVDQHIRTIDRALTGGVVAHDSAVIDSWRRCVEHHGLDPVNPSMPQILPRERLREHQEQSEWLTRLARGVLKTLFHHVSRQDYVVLLADKTGVAVDHFGETDLETELKSAGLTLGANWSEQFMGTNGVGAVLETHKPMNIHQRDHFNFAHTDLTCSAAPIFDSRGALVAVLDISRINAPQAKVSQDFALQLVQASARRIELANLETKRPNDWLFRFSTLPDMLDTDPEAAISLSEDGTIVGATHNAIRFLSDSDGTDWRKTGGVVGQNFSRFFDMDVHDIGALKGTRPVGERIIRLRSGASVFAQSSIRRRNRAKQYPARDHTPIQKALGSGDTRIEALTQQADRLAMTRLPILIGGETGTGKELLARAIHKMSGKDKPFVAINCAALPAEQLDADLFGSFGRSGRRGLIETASGGTLFLDEIGDLTLQAQARLLRVLQDGHVRPLDGGATLKTEFRLISATQRDLTKLVDDGLFREDLLFRIAAATLEIPPLRERSDTVEIAQRILRRITISRPESWRLTHAAAAEISRRTWCGNLRELRSALEVAAAMSDRPVIDAEDLPPSLLSPESNPTQSDDLLALLQACDWNLTRAARRMGVDRSTIHRRMRRCGIQRP